VLVATGVLLVVGPAACVGPQSAAIEGNGIRIEFDSRLRSQVLLPEPKGPKALTSQGDSEFLEGLDPVQAETLLIQAEEAPVQDDLGRGRQLTATGLGGQLRKDVMVGVYDDFPGFAVFRVRYTNVGKTALDVKGWVSHSYRFPVAQGDAIQPPFWSYHGASYDDRRDWVRPVSNGFAQDNYFGMNSSDSGGGTPVVDIWRKDVGLAVGHLETVPRQVSIPVRMDGAESAAVAFREERKVELAPGQSLETLRTFVAVHKGDYFVTLKTYRNMMERLGIPYAAYPAATYDPAWCAWGYERDFTPAQVLGTLPKVKEVGFKWAVLDDGWQTAEGDWYLNPKKFPRGDADIRKLTDAIKANGLRPGLWWAPMSVDPGTDLIRDHPDYLLLNQDGKPRDISWWDAYYLCPAYPPVREREKELLRKMFQTWGFQSLKLDGQFLNAAPPCYNPAHHHLRPEESVEAIPGFLKELYDAAIEIDRGSVVQLCPCGTAYSIFSMPYFNQPVSSDPLSSWQIRLKGKTFKALMGSTVPYYGDHVELSDGGDDFASTVGIGGVPGSKFTWPIGARKNPEFDLTPEREQIWKHWIQIYTDKMLPKGEYLGELYDIGFDRPETHAIAKGEVVYYAFFAPDFQGEVELRGLQERAYRVTDFVNGRDYGSVIGATAKLQVQFAKSLLLEAVPE